MIKYLTDMGNIYPGVAFPFSIIPGNNQYNVLAMSLSFAVSLPETTYYGKSESA